MSELQKLRDEYSIHAQKGYFYMIDKTCEAILADVEELDWNELVDYRELTDEELLLLGKYHDKIKQLLTQKEKEE